MYNIKTFQLTDDGVIPIEYHNSNIFIQQEDAAMLYNRVFTKQYRKAYGEIIGVILHSAEKAELPIGDYSNKGLLGILCV